eukprot:348447-Prorocentrum_minimum.AAC.3
MTVCTVPGSPVLHRTIIQARAMKLAGIPPEDITTELSQACGLQSLGLLTSPPVSVRCRCILKPLNSSPHQGNGTGAK